MVDLSEDHLFGHGFDRSVCEGCPAKNGGMVDTCGKCGCPLRTLSAFSAPPASCIRLDQHEGQ